ncbi:terminase small subunit [Eubacterium ventriosum]|uniref:terminase small subunit n=1 Tax=Eubacterium ventriosum TaxID=39496 RepID=UPI00265E32EF|nr:terminase small subunit [Eubacterium ventriosum]
MSNELKKYEQAETDYMNGLKYKEIAEKYSVSISTVKSWKTRYNWNRKGQKSTRTKKEKVCIQNTTSFEEINQVIEDENLTDEQRLFCIYYVRCFNATKAYMKAYGVKYNVAAVSGCRLLQKEKIRKCITELKQNRLNREMLSEEDIFQKYMDIAFADITDYVSFGREETAIMGPFGPIKVKDEEGNDIELKQNINVVRFKNSDEVDGTLISDINLKNSSVKLLDRMKALDWLANHMDMATTEQRARIELLNVQVDRATGRANEDEINRVDELLMQIKKQAGDKDGSK